MVVEFNSERHMLSERGGTAPKASSPIASSPTGVHRCADDVLGGRARTVEERLVELAVPGDLDDRADVDASGLVHRDEQVRQTFVALGAPSQWATTKLQ